MSLPTSKNLFLPGPYEGSRCSYLSKTIINSTLTEVVAFDVLETVVGIFCNGGARDSMEDVVHYV